MAKSKPWRNVDARSAPTAGERPPKANVTTSQKQDLVVEADNEVSAIAIAESKRAANDRRNSSMLIQRFTSTVKVSERRAIRSSMRD
ncbi:MAG: hypothetical protein E6G78_21965 [Alphaproteobacteria bacterium]|nr:MAG: hypothetical protein E6G78_21965 [Alphaproteobacteria bacterium]